MLPGTTRIGCTELGSAVATLISSPAGSDVPRFSCPVGAPPEWQEVQKPENTATTSQ